MGNLKPRAIMCDLDGTLCINDQGRSPYDYKEARHDSVNPAVATALWAFVNGNSDIDIVFFSARELYGEVTAEAWMRHHLPWLFFKPLNLFLKPNKDYRQDAIVKEEMYRQLVEPYWDVLFVLDDRQGVTNMWRHKLGLTCFQVAEGKF